MTDILIAYVPVLHEGYAKLFRKYTQGDLYVLGQDLIDELREGHQEIRALDPKSMTAVLARSAWFRHVRLLTKEMAEVLGRINEDGKLKIHFPDEVISRRFAERYLAGQDVTFESIFLRWDSESVLSQSVVDYSTVSTDESHQKLMAEALAEAQLSLCHWRQVGGLVVKDGRVLYKCHNQHVPSEEAHFAEGDPRDFVEAGQNTDIATTLHVEQAIIAWAAKNGVSLEGCDLVVTVYPCPVCAKLVAYSGFSRVFFATGHASLDGERILKSQDVELVLVKM